MNKNMKVMTASLLAIAVLGTSGFVMASELLTGSKAAAADTSFTLPEMLTYAIQDEYTAKAEYAAIIDAFNGVARPFTNIINAETRHIDELMPLFETYQVMVPANQAADQTTVPATLAEAFAIGVDAEEKNIAMYESFLKQDLPVDVRDVFENLRDGSLSHLAAFQRGTGSDRTGAGSGWSRNNQGNRPQNAGLQNGCDIGTANQGIRQGRISQGYRGMAQNGNTANTATGRGNSLRSDNGNGFAS